MQRQVLILSLIVLILIVLFPQWRYLDGSRGGFAPVFDPPPALPDSVTPGDPMREYMEIKIIPMAAYNIGAKTQFTDEQLRQPYIDIRRLMNLGGIVFVLAVAGLFLAGRNAQNRHPDRS